MKRWKKLLLYSVSLLCLCLAGTAIIRACTDEPDPYDYYTSFFHADVQGQKDYGAFYFTDYSFTYTDTEPVSEDELNAQEWAAYLGVPVQAADVHRAMYGTDSAARLSLLQHFTQSTPLPDSLAQNSFLTALASPARAGALNYYKFALQAEPLANQAYNLWNPAPVDTTGLSSAAGEAAAQAGQAPDDFLKLRYYYQAQRLWHYGQNYAQARTVYQQHIAPMGGTSHVKGWALACKAGEDRRLGDTVLAAYEFSKVFTGYPERRLLAYRNYHYINAPFSAVMRLAKTDQEKANLYAIEGFGNANIETDGLKQVYRYAPASPMVGVLLVREINKLESSWLTPALANNTDAAYLFHSSPAAHAGSERPSIAKWPLILGVLLLAAGLITALVPIRQQRNRRTSVLAGGGVALAGILLLGWFMFKKSGSPYAGIHPATPQGSFFVTVPDSLTRKYNAHIEALRSFCTQLADDRKYPAPQLGTLVNAYLYFMQNKPEDGLSTLAKLKSQSLDSKLADQQQIIHLLLSAQRLKTVTQVDEQSLLPTLQWLDKKAAQHPQHKDDVYPEPPGNHNFFNITARNFYTYVLAPAYLRQGDTARAALALLKSGNVNSYIGYESSATQNSIPDFWFNYLHSSQLRQLLSWRLAPAPVAYLSFLSSNLKSISADKLQELLGTVYLREHRYAEAASAFRQIKSSKLLNTPYNGQDAFQGDPFHVEVNDYPKTFTGERYTKLKFAVKMAVLQADTTHAEACYQLANGLYNTSTYGTSWGLISYSWSSTDYSRELVHYYDGDYIQASLALKYYLKARQLTRNPELQARCTFMAANCEQKTHRAAAYTDADDYKGYLAKQKIFEASLRHNSYFSQMQRYKNTAFYKRAVNECSYLSDFVYK